MKLSWTRRFQPLGVLALSVGFALAFLLVPASDAQKGGKSSDTPVTSTLNETGDVSAGTNHRIQADGAGSYFNGVASVKSILQSIGDWEMDTSSSTSRSTLVDFRDPVAGSSTSSAPFNWQLVHARWISKCTQTQSGGYLTVSVGTPVNCPLHAVFSYGGSDYRLTMNPVNDGATSFAQVTCNATNGAGQCNSWTVAPVTQADSSVRSIAVLLRDTRVKGKTITTNLGYFYMTFQIDITNP